MAVRGLVTGLVVLSLGSVFVASVTGSSRRAVNPCAGAMPARWKPWSNVLRGDVTGGGKPDTIFVGQRYAEKPSCRRLLFVETGAKLLVAPLVGSNPAGSWDILSPAPVALAAIDQHPGAEIVVRVGVGRVTEWAAIYAVRGDRIIRYSMPRHWIDGDTFNYGWSDAASYSWAATVANCIGRHSGVIEWSRAYPTPWPPSRRVRTRYVVERTVLRIVGWRFVVVFKARSILNRLPPEFTRSKDGHDRIFPDCLVAHDWAAGIPPNPKEPSPG